MASTNDAGFRRIAVYNGQTWDMGPNVSPDVFLNSALIPHFPDLRGAKWTRNQAGEEVRYEFAKRSGEKG